MSVGVPALVHMLAVLDGRPAVLCGRIGLGDLAYRGQIGPPGASRSVSVRLGPLCASLGASRILSVSIGVSAPCCASLGGADGRGL